MKMSVALCTYNGDLYLCEQLASIAAQTRQPDELVVCDDGSTDGTLSILEKFAKNAAYPVHIVRNTNNLGVVANFQQAVKMCAGELTSLADQDDVWLPDKLKNAEIEFLNNMNPENLLYCTRLQYVDSNLEPLGFSSIPHAICFENAITENIATGCTIVFGSELKKHFLNADASDMAMHDWWLYLVATTFGKTAFDPVPSIAYRQHGKNVAGWKPRPIKLIHRTLSLRKRLHSGPMGMDSLNQAARFIKAYPQIPSDKREIVSELIQLRKSGLLGRLRYLTRARIMRNDFFENLGLKIIILMGWL